MMVDTQIENDLSGGVVYPGGALLALVSPPAPLHPWLYKVCMNQSIMPPVHGEDKRLFSQPGRNINLRPSDPWSRRRGRICDRKRRV